MSGHLIRSVPVAIVAGVPVDDVTMDETVELVEQFVEAGRSSGRTFQIATVNVDFVVNARRDPDVMSILRGAELCIPDGMPIVWHARVTRTPLRDRVAGADLVPALVDRSQTTGWRILLFGSAEGVAEQAATLLTERSPSAAVRGISGPVLRDPRVMEQRWIDEIVEFAPDIICVALGNPKQERWIDAHRSLLGAAVLIGVGGTLDFLVGGRRRAPEWMRRSGLEWVYRASQEPGRLGRRYAHDGRVFGPLLARAAARRMSAARRPQTIAETPLGSGSAVVLDLGSVTADPVVIARLVGLGRDAHRRGGRVEVSGAGPDIRRAVEEFDVHRAIDFR